MKKLLLAGVAAVGLMAASGIAHATLTWTVWNGGGLPISLSPLSPTPIPPPALPTTGFVTTFNSNNDAPMLMTAAGGTNTLGEFFNGYQGYNGVGAGLTMSTANNTLTTFIHASETYTDQGGLPARNLTHDDGAEIFVNGAFVCGSPGPNPPVNDACVFPNGGTGSKLDLYYIESNGSPAVLSVILPTEAPEPASLALLGSALVGFGVWRRRRRTS